MNITIPANSITALVGPSGSGKLFSWQVWDVNSGRIEIISTDIKSIGQHLMSYMSLFSRCSIIQRHCF